MEQIYIINKILNNNVVLSSDIKKKKEIILMGCGIAFKKKVGEDVDGGLIEKTFIIEDKIIGEKIKTLIGQIPNGIFQLAQEIILEAENKLERKLDKQIYISLADHISFALKRNKMGIDVQNPLMNEIKLVHRKEYDLGIWAVEHINKRVKINLLNDEAAFIALHLVNASYKYGIQESQTIISIVNDVLNIVKSDLKIEFNENDINYDRLLTHLKFFAKRILSSEKNIDNDVSFLDMIKNSYKESYRCSIKVKKHIKEKYNYKINNNEVVYLSMHIERVLQKSRIE